VPVAVVGARVLAHVVASAAPRAAR
jgi:hypothetical protein